MDIKSDKLKKSLKTNNKIILGVILLVLGVLIIGGGYYYNNFVTVKHLDDAESEGDVVRLDISEVYEAFAIFDDEDSSPKFHFVTDENGYFYAAFLSNKTYNKLSSMSEEDLANNPVTVVGKAYNTPDDVISIAIEVLDEVWGDDFPDGVTTDDYYDYYGYVYLDEADYFNFTGILIYAIGGISFVIGLYFTLSTIINKKKTIGITSQSDMDKLCEDVDDAKISDTINGLFFTKDSLVSTKNGLDIINYNDVIWFYTFDISGSRSLILYTNDKVKHNITNLKNINNDSFNEIKDFLKKKCKSAMNGYSKENRNTAKELYNIKN